MLKINYQLRRNSVLQASLNWGYKEKSSEGKVQYRGLRLSTGIKCDPSQFDQKKKMPIEESHSIAEFENKVRNCFQFLEYKLQVITPELFKQELDVALGKKKAPLEYTIISQFIRERMLSGKADITRRNYKSLANHIECFEREFKTKMTSQTVNESMFLMFFDHWKKHSMRKTRNGQRKSVPQVRKLNTIWSLEKNLKAVLNQVRRIHPEMWDYSTLQLKDKTSYVQSEFAILEWDQIKRIVNYKSSKPYLENCRYILLTLCLTGCRYSDVFKTYDHIVDLGDFKASEYVQSKRTNKALPQKVCIPLFEPLMSLYQSKNSGPRQISNQKFNKYLKELCTEIGFNHKVNLLHVKANGERIVKEVQFNEVCTSHIGRRSFVSHFISLVPAPLLAAVTGHSLKSSELGILFSYCHKPIRKLSREFHQQVSI